MKQKIILIFYLTLSPLLFSQQVENLDNQFRLAQSYEQAGQYDKAENIYNELLNRQAWNISFFEALNKLYIKQKKYDASVTLLENRLQSFPGDVSAYGLLGSTFYLMDEREKAEDIWRRGIATNPASAVVYRVIANYAIENRSFDTAIEILKAGQSKSDDPLLFAYDLANIYSINMNFKSAAEEYCTLLISRPEQIGVVKARMTGYINRPSAALETLETVKSKAVDNPTPALLELLAAVYKLTLDYRNAFETTIKWDESIRSSGNNVFVFAQEAFRDRQFEIAADAYKYIIDKFPKSPFIPISRIGFARALEAGLDSKSDSAQTGWKPFAYPPAFDAAAYTKIINTYDQLIKEYSNNAVAVEALFRNAEITNHRLYNYSKADSIYEEVIKISPVTNYALLSYLERARIMVLNNKFGNAREMIKAVLSNPRADNQIKNEAGFLKGKIEFWESDFKSAGASFQEVTKDLSGNFTNDALEISALMNAAKQDSAGLAEYAEADLSSFQSKFSEAAEIFKKLNENGQNIIIKEYSAYKYAEMLIAEDNFNEAVKVLEEISDSSEYKIFSDKATFLLAMTYGNGLKNYSKYGAKLEKILDKFPESLYFESARVLLNKIKTK